MPCMMIGVPSHVVIAVDVGSALRFLGRAEAVAAVPRTRTARARVAILNNGRLMLMQISSSCSHPLLARWGDNVFFIAHGETVVDRDSRPSWVKTRRARIKLVFSALPPRNDP